MSSSENNPHLFGEFPPVSTAEWEEMILKDLKGADYQKRLIWKGLEEISVRPYYREEDLKQFGHIGSAPGEYPFVRGNHLNGNTWLIRQDVHFEGEAGATLNKIRHLLDRGVESINLIFAPGVSDAGAKALFDMLPLEEAEFNTEDYSPINLLEWIKARTTTSNLDPGRVRFNLQWDPIGDFMLSGRWPGEAADYDRMAEAIRLAEGFDHVKLLTINGRYFKNSGSTMVQELAFSLAAASDYLAELTDHGVAPETAARHINFGMSVGPNYFFEIARFRSARLLWSKLLESYGVKGQSAQLMIHAESSRWNKSLYDPHVNLLRSTTEAMSAILGGVHSLTLLPFDFTYQTPGDFSERLARNQQILLREESYLDKVADPAGGSYYLEYLTHSIAEAAWTMFQKVEEMGGLTEAFYQGWVQNEIVTGARSRDESIAQRREILLGINQYPDLSEQMLPKIQLDRVISPVPDTAGADAQPLIPYRGSEAFEALRLATEKSGSVPKVFLLTIGNLAMRRARAGFATNFFGCAGYQVIDTNGFDSLTDGMEAARAVKADLVVLCSSDEEYASLAPEALGITQGREILVIAGNPVAIMDDLKKAGVEHFIHLKSHVLNTLKNFNRLLGIPIYQE